MKLPNQLNGEFSFGRQPMQRHRIYDIHNSAIACQSKGGGQDKAICLCATLYKGGGNNSVTYIIELYEKRE